MTIYEWLEQRDIHITNKKLMETAFTHSSYVNEHKSSMHDNERLEFMGDAVLQIWSSINLFAMRPELPEGRMTTLRASLVCEKSLAEYATKLHLNDFLKLGIGEEKNGGRYRDSVVSDMFEAFIGALYLNCGLDAVSKIMAEVVDFDHLDVIEEEVIDYKTRLQEYVQSDNRSNVVYELVNMTGPSNKPEFTMNVLLDGIILGTGKGTSKKRAEQAAAKDAFNKMVKL